MTTHWNLLTFCQCIIILNVTLLRICGDFYVYGFQTVAACETTTLSIHIYRHYLRHLRCHGVPTTAKEVNSEIIYAAKHVYVVGPPRGFGNTLISLTRYLSISGDGQWSINDHLRKDIYHLDAQRWGVNVHPDTLHARICRAKLLVDRLLV